VKRILRITAVIICFSLAALHFGFSQATSGSVQGIVTDLSGAVVVGAVVTAKNENTGLIETARNDSDSYVLRNLPPGTYSLTVTKDGFKTIVRSGVLLLIDQKLRIDFSLAPGTASETVNVTTEAPLLQTQSVETGDVIQSRQILNLPLNGRNFLQLAKLTPGVASGGGGNTSDLAVNGQREFANSIMIDGIETTSNRNNDNSLSPSVDAVEEFKVVTSAYSAEYGHAAGGVVSIQTKAGSNAYHGSLYEFFRPNNTTAEAWTLLGPGVPSSLKHHNFGATIGGPIKKDKLFFFGSYEGFRLRDVFSFVNSVPPSNMVKYLPNGDVDLSGLIDPNAGGDSGLPAGTVVPIFDPVITASCWDPNFFYWACSPLQFPGNIIPANRVSPAGKAILQNFFPSPEFPGSFNGWYNNFQTRETFRQSTNNIDTRLDMNLSQKDRVAGVYHYGDLAEGVGDQYAGKILVSGGGTTDNSIQNSSADQSLSLSETHVFSPLWLNEFRFGYSRFRLTETDLLNGSNTADKFGVGNINLPGFLATQGFPQIALGTGYNTGGSTFLPLFFRDNNIQIVDNISVRRGKHDLKFGVDYRHLVAHPDFSLFPTGYQFYGGAYSSLTSDASYNVYGEGYYDFRAFFGNGGSDVADLLLGLPLTTNIGLQLTKPTTQSWETGFYFQDSWQVTPRLMVDYGIRYEYQAPYTEAANHASNFDLTMLSFRVAGIGGNSAGLINPDRNNFGPRLGFSYRLHEKTVIRAGWGLYYSPENDARSDVLTKNFPFAVQAQYFNDVLGSPTYQLDSGVPRDTTIAAVPANGQIPVADIPQSTVQQGFYVSPNFRTGYSELYNFTVQQELAHNMAFELGYVGSVGRKLPYAIGNVNKVDADGHHHITDDFGQIQGQFAVGSSNYHSLQSKLTKRWSGGLSFQASYTFGKSIDNGPAPFNLGKGITNHNQPQDPFNLARERAVSDNDIKHNLVVNAIYELPFGRGKRFYGSWNGVTEAVLGGWQVNTIFEARSGLPVNVILDGTDRINPGLRPNMTRDPNLASDRRTLAKYFDDSAFCKPSATCLPNNNIGNAPRNPIRGPGYVNTDFSLFKELSFAETKKIQFRFELFNLTNTPHFSSPGGDFHDKGSLAQIKGASGEREIQFALKFLF